MVAFVRVNSTDTPVSGNSNDQDMLDLVADEENSVLALYRYNGDAVAFTGLYVNGTKYIFDTDVDTSGDSFRSIRGALNNFRQFLVTFRDFIFVGGPNENDHYEYARLYNVTDSTFVTSTTEIYSTTDDDSFTGGIVSAAHPDGTNFSISYNYDGTSPIDVRNGKYSNTVTVFHGTQY